MTQLWPDAPNSIISYISPPPKNAVRERRNVVLLGSTGTIGKNALRIARETPDRINIYALAGGRNVALLANQAAEFRPKWLAAIDEEHAAKLKNLLPAGYAPEILTGAEGYAKLACLEDCDCALCAQVGFAGAIGAIAAAMGGKRLALANKEALVIAGGLLRQICHKTQASLLPVDSEHFAIFQCLAGRASEAAQLVLTASGGPFRALESKKLEKMRKEDALCHPTWNMGAKITIDSATLMNKGLEFIEAMHLFGVGKERIRILIHPQSIIHSLVKFRDNSFMAQLATPDMRLPIAASLLWPDSDDAFIADLDLASVGRMDFEAPDPSRFPCLALALKAAETPAPSPWRNTGLNPACIILNAANEAAVELFLHDQCGFMDIPKLVEHALNSVNPDSPDIIPWSESESIPQKALQATMPIKALDEKTRREVVLRAKKLR